MKLTTLLILLILNSCQSQEPTNGFDNPSFNKDFNESKARKETRKTHTNHSEEILSDTICTVGTNTCRVNFYKLDGSVWIFFCSSYISVPISGTEKKLTLSDYWSTAKDVKPIKDTTICFIIDCRNTLSTTSYNCKGNWTYLVINGHRDIDYPIEYMYSNRTDTFGFNRIEGNIKFLHDHQSYNIPKFYSLKEVK